MTASPILGGAVDRFSNGFLSISVTPRSQGKGAGEFFQGNRLIIARELLSSVLSSLEKTRQTPGCERSLDQLDQSVMAEGLLEFMKIVVSRGCAFLIFACATGAVDAADRHPTVEELMVLVQQVFAAPRESGDVTVLRTLTRRSTGPSEAQKKRASDGIRQAETAIANQDRSQGRKITDEEIEQKINSAIKLWESQHSRPMVLKQRFRIDRYKYRLDQVTSNDVEQVDADTEYVDTYVNMGNPVEDDNNGFHIDMRGKHAFRDNRKGTRWSQESALDLAGISYAGELILKTAFGKVQEPERTFLPDPEKIDRLTKGTDPDSRMNVRDDVHEGQPSVVLSIGISPERAKDFKLQGSVVLAEMTFVENFTRCVKEEMFNLQSGRLGALLTRSGFLPDSQIPSVVLRKTYDPMSGALVADDRIIVLAYELKPIPDEVFEFNPPEGFVVLDQRPGMERKFPQPTVQITHPVTAKSGMRTWVILANIILVAAIIFALNKRRKT